MSHPPTSSLFMPPCTGKTFTTSASPSVLCAMICAEPPRSYTTGRSGTRHHSAVTAPLNGGSGVKLDQCRIISIMQQPNAPSIGTGSRGDRGAARYFFMFSQRFAPTLTSQACRSLRNAVQKGATSCTARSCGILPSLRFALPSSRCIMQSLTQATRSILINLKCHEFFCITFPFLFLLCCCCCSEPPISSIETLICEWLIECSMPAGVGNSRPNCSQPPRYLDCGTFPPPPSFLSPSFSFLLNL